MGHVPMFEDIICLNPKIQHFVCNV